MTQAEFDALLAEVREQRDYYAARCIDLAMHIARQQAQIQHMAHAPRAAPHAESPQGHSLEGGG